MRKKEEGNEYFKSIKNKNNNNRDENMKFIH